MNVKTKLLNLIRLAALPCILAFVLCALPASLRAGTNLDEKARYEKVLEQKVEELLTSLLGPGMAKVMVQASIDFSAKESLTSAGGEQRTDGLATASALASSGGGGTTPPWWTGIMENIRQNGSSAGEGTNLQKEMVFPQAMIKRLTVSLALSESLSEPEAQKIRTVVSDMLGLDAGRGDTIIIMKAKFAPVWYTPEMFSLLVKYGVLATILIVAMGIVAAGFLKMAGAMNSMAGTGQQKISMEMNSGVEMGDKALELGLPEPAIKAQGAGSREDQHRANAPSSEEVVFNVPPGKLGVLVGMLNNQEPADIALIAVHLPSGLMNQFISRFPSEKVADICASIAAVRFVDPEMIAKIKEELERRLSGAVGGEDKLLEVIASADIKTKKTLFENLKKNHPEVAAQVRPSIIFMEDIDRLSEKDFSMLVSAVSVEQWTLAVWELPESARPKLKAQLTNRSWQMVEQTMKFGRPSEDKINKAVEKVIASVWNLIAESKISNPNAADLSSAGGGQAKLAFKHPPVLTPEAAAPGASMRGKKIEADIIGGRQRRDLEDA